MITCSSPKCSQPILQPREKAFLAVIKGLRHVRHLGIPTRKAHTHVEAADLKSFP